MTKVKKFEEGEDDVLWLKGGDDDLNSEENCEEAEDIAWMEAEREDRRQAREHIEKLAHIPECALLATQCELERIRANGLTQSFRRETKRRLQIDYINQVKTYRKQKFVLKVLQILSFTSIAITACVILSPIFTSRSRSTPTESSPKGSIAAELNSSVPTPPSRPVEQVEAPVERPRFFGCHGRRAQCSAPLNETTAADEAGFRYVIVRQKN